MISILTDIFLQFIATPGAALETVPMCFVLPIKVHFEMLVKEKLFVCHFNSSCLLNVLILWFNVYMCAYMNESVYM